ncbi:DUF4959 domain-containing protein [Puteibacter caeruleilacunae]|nr:DUF4959 domain-containing protein [Puteibacter caeruleilacunae]
MKLKYLIYSSVFFLLCLGCGEEKVYEALYNSTHVPGSVANVVVENGPGEATISYDLSNDRDIAYVKGTYTVNGEEKAVISSVSKNHLLIEGLPEAKEYPVSLVVYSNSNVAGSEVNTVINPSEPYYKVVGRSVDVFSDFGGALIKWDNEERKELLVIVSSEDSTGTMDVVDYHQTTQVKGELLLTGYEPEETAFSVQVRDKWSNLSDSVNVAITPLYEERLDGKLWTLTNLETDYPGDVGGFEKLDDGKTRNGGDRWTVEYKTNVQIPPYYSFTFDLGVSAVISRFHYFNRWSKSWSYNNTETEFFEVYGSNELSPDWDDWTDLTPDYMPQITKRSGLPVGQNNDEDKQAAYDGYIFRCDASLGAFRYIRVRLIDNFGHNPVGYTLTELNFYGQVEGE